MPGRKSQKRGGSCSFVSQNRNRGGSKKAKRSMRGGGCGYSGEPRRAGAKRSMRGGGCGYSGEPRRAGAKRSMRGGGGCHCNTHGRAQQVRRRSRKSRSKKRKGFVVVCPAPDGSCRRR